MENAKVNSISINYLLEGPSTGDLVVLINGLADDLKTWDYQIPALHSAGYQTLRYDNRGIGESSRPAGPYTSEMMADDLHALLVKLDIDKFHLLGVSMGGMIAQSYALKYSNGSAAANGKELLSLSLCCAHTVDYQSLSMMFANMYDRYF